MAPRKSHVIRFVCDCCAKTVTDPYTKDWIHVDGHLAVSFGRDADGRGISTSFTDEFYCCSFRCFTDVFILRLKWNDPRKNKGRDGT